MLAQLVRFFKPSHEQLAAHDLYLKLVEQARNPVFYRDWGVPDTLDGRFELILLHMFLVLGRLKQEEDSYEAQQRLIEVFFDDMDRSVRELGVGDTGVSRRVKAMANAFYGRMKAYDDASEDHSTLAEALKKNLYGTAPEAGDATPIIKYMNDTRATLSGQAVDQILAANIEFPKIA